MQQSICDEVVLADLVLALNNWLAVAHPIAPEPLLADINRRATASEWVDYFERLGIKVKQVIEPADFAVPGVVRAGCLLLLLPDVIEWRLEVNQLISSSLLL